MNEPSNHRCVTCGDTFEVWPAVPVHKADQWAECLAWQCPSYTPTRDPELIGGIERTEGTP
jgi:hypothetical protein